MKVEERGKKAADLVAENAKQLVTVAAGILTFTVTFYEKLKPASGIVRPVLWLLVGAWILYLMSMWYGFKTIDGLTIRLETYAETFSVLDGPVANRARLQRRLFLAASVLVLLFGAVVVYSS